MKKEVKQEIINKAFSNFCFAIVLGSFAYFLNLGYVNISSSVFMTDLKMLGACVALISIFVIERAYRLDDDELALQGIEIFILSIITIMMQLIVVNEYPFIIINCTVILSIILYYILKTIIYLIKKKKI